MFGRTWIQALGELITDIVQLTRTNNGICRTYDAADGCGGRTAPVSVSGLAVDVIIRSVVAPVTAVPFGGQLCLRLLRPFKDRIRRNHDTRDQKDR